MYNLYDMCILMKCNGMSQIIFILLLYISVLWHLIKRIMTMLGVVLPSRTCSVSAAAIGHKIKHVQLFRKLFVFL